MNILQHISAEKMKDEPVPIQELLKDSLYYPSSGFDGGVVKYFSSYTQSFIYCDYGIKEDEFLREMNGFYGYHVLSSRALNPSELTPTGWQMKLPPRLQAQEYLRERRFIKKPFAHWVVYERNEDFDESHGPKRFSLIYIGGEGVATYQALYWSNQVSPKILAIIQPGTAFGGNYTDFCKKDGYLAWVALNNPNGTPEMILYGGYGEGYENNFDWDGYKMIRSIHGYYPIGQYGMVTVWNRKN